MKGCQDIIWSWLKTVKNLWTKAGVGGRNNRRAKAVAVRKLVLLLQLSKLLSSCFLKATAKREQDELIHSK